MSRHRVVSATRVPAEVWDNFARENGSLHHARAWRNWTLSITDQQDRAFALYDGNELAAIAPAERSASDGGVVWAPALNRKMGARRRAAALGICLVELEQRIPSPLRICLDPLTADFSEASLDFAAATTRRGYRDVSLTTVILDLALSPHQLWEEMSNRHRTSLKDCRVRTRTLADEEAFAEFRRIHRLVAGDRTRPFELMYGWPNRRVILAEVEGQVAGASLILLWGHTASDAARATVPQFASEPVGHAMVWEAMKTLPRCGTRRYELGAQHRGLFSYDEASEKEQNLSLFRRGFGGVERPLLIRER